MKAPAIDVHSALEQSGLDHGPISVHDKMRAMGLDVVPSVASLARVFREAGVARLEPKKRPRAAWRRFVYPAPNAFWQLDATEYVRTGGRKCVVFQLIDDHSRYAVASHVATGETAKDAIKVIGPQLAPGVYTITEASIPGWTLSALRCTGNATTDLRARTAVVRVSAGERASCTFTNARTVGPTPPDLPATGVLPSVGAGETGIPLVAGLVLLVAGAVLVGQRRDSSSARHR